MDKAVARSLHNSKPKMHGHAKFFHGAFLLFKKKTRKSPH
jgi:hypothetical protein